VKKIVLLCTTAMLPSAVYAQSTGTVTTEEQIVITGARGAKNVNGFQVPDTTKAKAVISQELIARQQPGQTILNVVNLVPSVNFTNSDPYGSSGGNIRIRGFDGNRISLTFDGVPLNDSGNYAIFSNQQLDPELVEQVNVGLGVTDVDSPTASAAGGTINYRTLIPSNEMGARINGSIGDWSYYRAFGLFQTGEFTSFGTKAWISASHAENEKFKGPGKINKYQFNGRIYQPVGSNGDFISVAGHYNRNRNNFYRNPSINDLRAVLGASEIPATPSQSPAGTFNPTSANPFLIGYLDANQERAVLAFDNLASCNRLTPLAGVRQNDNGGTGPNGTLPNASPNLPVPLDRGANYGSNQNNPANSASCTNYYNVRINPSNTGNIRGQSKFTLADGIILTVDPSYQYVLANGGGSTTIDENSRRTRGANQTGTGIDYNGDGDTLDTVRFYTPNNTNTNRFGLTSSLIWDIAPQHRVRVAYTYDRAQHRQTGEWGYLEQSGDPESVFGGRNARPVLTASGFQIQQRDRKSIALLNQISGQYIGKFFEDKLRLELGLRRPFFKRDLETFCPIEAAGSSGFAYCTDEPIIARGGAVGFVFPANTPNGGIPIYVNQGDNLSTLDARFRPVFAPFEAHYKFGKILPNLGFTYNFTNAISTFGSYAKGFSAPRTDNLYRAPVVDVQPEETNAYDLGVRYTTSRIQAQLAGWKIDYKNRIVSSFNPDLGISLDRNVGKVKSWGFDGNIGFRPTPKLTLLAVASYIKAKLQDNVELSTSTAAALPAGLVFCSGVAPTGTTRATTCVPTAGKFVTETPKWQYGGRAQWEIGPFSFGAQAKHVGARFATDVNDVKVKGYNIVDLDARVNLGDYVGLKRTFLQFNLQNAFDEFYFGNISTQLRATDNPNFAVGSPRTFSATLDIGF
jgi:iron complex outermembrane recepter protein